jgi:dGTPase
MNQPTAPSAFTIPRSRPQMEEVERLSLAPFAQKAADSAGRAHREKPHPHRTEYQRDRARVIHSRAFRRLEYKTQVFLNGLGDHFRNRLTHTIEVASISRSIARALALNEDLAEAIALAHDLGHSPFGHSGEEMLDELMQEHGGFEHNLQSLRIVETIEQKYPKFPGLNLSFEVIEGLKKHAKFYDPPEKNQAAAGEKYACPSLEAQIANLADEITYYSHDLDDGLDAGLIQPEQLEELELWHACLAQVHGHFPRLRGRALHTYVIRCLIDYQVEDVIRTSAALITKSGVQSADDVRRQPKPLIRYSAGLLKANRQLRKFLYQNLYYHPRVAGANQRACELLREVFQIYLAKPVLLGRTTAQRLKTDGLHRTVCDYLSGMTDRYLIEEHTRLGK